LPIVMGLPPAGGVNADVDIAVVSPG